MDVRYRLGPKSVHTRLRTAALESTVRAGDFPGHNHRFDVVSGVRADEARELMQEFFKARRARKDAASPDEGEGR